MTSNSHPAILRIPLGTSSAYLIPAHDGWILVDAGNKGRERQLFHTLDERGIAATDIRLIVVTHVHFDHVGGLNIIQRRTHAQVLVHTSETDLLENGTVVIPTGVTPFTRPASALGQRIGPRLLRFTPCKVDYRVNETYSLASFGLDGYTLHTPGHSAGSISVITDDGSAVVGDLCHNGYPFGLGPILPPFASDLTTLLVSCHRLIDLGVHTIYPGHGMPFAADRLREKLRQKRGG